MSEPSYVVGAARRLPVQASVAYEAWLDPGVARRWLFATATAPNACVNVEAWVGGTFLCVAREAGGEVAYEGRYLELVAPRRLAFDLTRAGPGMESTRVVVDIESRHDGCRVALAQRSVPRDARARVRARWIGMLHGLDEVLGDAMRGSTPHGAPSRRVVVRRSVTNGGLSTEEIAWTTC